MINEGNKEKKSFMGKIYGELLTWSEIKHVGNNFDLSMLQ